MAELLVCRHAKAERGRAVQDRERRLTEIGRADAQGLGRLLLSQGFIPDVILCSVAARARETAELLAAEFPGEPLRLDLPELYDAGASDILPIVRAYAPEARRPMVVGHNPGLESFVCGIAGRDLVMKTACVAVVEAAEGARPRLKAIVLPSRRIRTDPT